MILSKGVEILDGLPVLHLEGLSAIVCSDLHLGYEGVMTSKGIFTPKINLRKIKETIKKAVDKSGASRIIVDGDIKNEFSDVNVEEFNEFYDLTKYLKEELGIENITLIKGNHDNFIDRYRDSLGIKIHNQETVIDNFLFFHGEELPRDKKTSFLIMGHLHPAIALYSKLGVKEKLKCFLYGKIANGRDLLVLPAMSYFAEGVEVNQGKADEIAPIFKKIAGIGKMHALCIGEDETLDFGSISELMKLDRL